MRFCLALATVLLSLAPALPAVSQSEQAVPAPTTGPVAMTPPMGWNSWNFFAGKVTDKDIRAAADQIVSSGMKDAGYVYINIDDTWEGLRDSAGYIHSNQKFPNMKALADYVHSKGLLLGIYSSPGPRTCAGFAASYGHEEQDATTYAEWGIDYVKYDLCSFIEIMHQKAPDDKAAQMQMMIDSYDKMSKALKAAGEKAGRPIVLSLCQYGWDAVWEWAPALGGNLWRTTGDIEPHWQSIYSIASAQSGLESYAGPGHWNDPDMLEVGNGKLSLAENRTHFSWWAMLAAPLLAGNDLPNMKPEILAILTNKDVIAIDQDPLGKQARHAYSDGEVEVWTKRLKGGALAIAIINVGSDRYSTHPFYLKPAALGIGETQFGKNLWTGKQVILSSGIPIELASHDVLLVRIDKPTGRAATKTAK